jgi:predicted GNAT superfamily acetyltransferase
MDFEIRQLETAEELEGVVELQMRVGGLPERHVTSPITLKVLTLDHPRIGYVLGAFEDGRMIGFTTAFSTKEPDMMFGFMLAVDPAYQNSGAGMQLLEREWEIYRRNGVKRVCWTYEPLEAKNAHLYLNKMGARCVRYIENYYYLDTGLHAGLPQDRFMVEYRLDHDPGYKAEPVSLEEALNTYPVARPDHLPEADAVLVELPHKLHELLPRDPEAAKAFRMDTRVVFNRYINDMGYEAVGLLLCGTEPGTKAFYLVKKA